MEFRYYDFIILINHEDCLKDINKLREELARDFGFKISNHKTSEQWLLKAEKQFIKNNKESLIFNIKNKLKPIVAKYQPNNAKNKNFIDSVFWYTLTNEKFFISRSKLKVISRINKETGEKEVFIRVYKWTKKQDLIDSWEKIISNAINRLPDEEIDFDKNKIKNFETNLQIYKHYLIAKNKWRNEKHLFKKLYESIEIEEIFDKLKEIPSLENFKKIIINFEKKYSNLNLPSELELKKH